jgi:L-iditol 2-dehydrogenase
MVFSLSGAVRKGGAPLLCHPFDILKGVPDNEKPYGSERVKETVKRAKDSIRQLAMKAARFVDNSLKLVDESVPVLRAGEVLINVKAAAICGSDKKILEGKKTAAPNTVLGHEIAGVVGRADRAVADVAEGDRIAVFPSITCGHCTYCRSGKTNICENKRTVGYVLDGGFAEHLVVPEEMVRQGCLVRLPPRLSFEEGALMEPFSCCVSSLKHAGMNDQSRILIIGGGPMGQLHVIAAKVLGVKKIFLSEPCEARRNMALDLGADGVLDPSKGSIEDLVRQETGGIGADICIVCVGAVSALTPILKAVRKQGVISFFASFPPHTEATIDPNIVHYEELTVTGTHSTTLKQFIETVVLVDRYEIELKPIITHRFPLERIHDAFEAYEKGDGLKVVVEPSCS